MKNHKSKYIYLFLMLLILLVTLCAVSATDTSNNNSNTINEEIDTSSTYDTSYSADVLSEDKENQNKTISSSNLEKGVFADELGVDYNISRYVSNYTELVSAIESASSSSDSYVIYLNNGNYTVTRPIRTSLSNVDDIVILGNYQTINGNKSTFINMGSSYLTIYNLTIKNCSNSYGGAINTNNGVLNLCNVTFENNSAQYGGAIHGQNTTMTIINSTFYINSANIGGAISSINKTNLTIVNSTFKKNNAVVYDGGAIYSIYTVLKLNNTLFEGNYAYNCGGAIGLSLTGYNRYDNTTKKIISTTSFIHNSTFINNHADKNSSILSSILGNLELRNNAFVGNTQENYISIVDGIETEVNNNWWGLNNPDFTVLTNNITPDTWIIMNTSNSSNSGQNNIRVSLNYLNNGNRSQYTTPTRTVVFMVNNGSFSSNTRNITNNVTNTYTGNSTNIYATIDNQTIKIGTKLEPYMVSSSVKGNKNQIISLKVILNKDVTGNVSIIIENKTIATKTITNGSISYNYTIPSTLYGVYNVTYIYTGNSRYSSKTINASLTVDKTNKTITATNTSGYLDNINTTTYPSSYDYRTLNLTTPVLNQGSSGACWAFGSLTALESTYLKILNESYKFSENQMKNSIKYYGTYGNDDPITLGSTIYETVSYYTSWLGPVYESREAFNDSSMYSVLLDQDIQIQDVYFLPERKNYTDNDAIKHALINYGAVFTGIYQSSIYLGSNGAYYNYMHDSSQNHLVCIVGYDDNYSASNFKRTALGDGAFIVKNSWGSDFGDDGYEYVSYYDVGIYDFRVFLLNNTNTYDNIYQYEYVSEDLYEDYGDVWMKNIYTAQRDETIEAVGTIFLEQSNYTINIYVNGNLKCNQSGAIYLTGYRTIPLNQYIEINKDDEITVVMQLVSLEADSTAIFFQTATDYRLNVKSGVSYVSDDGKDWFDLTTKKYSNINPGMACLKLYTKTTPQLFTYVQGTNDNIINTTIVNMNTTGYVMYKLNGDYIRYSNGTIIVTNLTNNEAITNYSLKDYNGSYVLTTILVTPSETITQDYIGKHDVSITLAVNSTAFKVNDKVKITATFIDELKNPLVNQNVSIIVNSDVRTLRTNNNGIATLNYTLIDGGYIPISVVYAENSNYSYAFEQTTIAVKGNTTLTLALNTTIGKLNNYIRITATLRNVNSRAIANKTINFTIDGVKYSAVTSNSGVATLNYLVPSSKTSGIINITARFTGDELYTNSTANRTINMTYKATMELLTSSYIVRPGDSIKLIAHITDNGVNADGGRLVFKFNGVTLKDNKGNAIYVNVTKGLAVLTYNIPDSMVLEKYNFTAVFSSSLYDRTEVSTTLTLTKIKTHIAIDTIYTKTNTFKVTAYIYDEDNNLIQVNNTISIKISGTSFNTVSNNGKVSLTVTLNLKNGVYNLTIVSGPKGKYLTNRTYTYIIKGNTSKVVNQTRTSTSVSPSTSGSHVNGVVTLITGAYDVKAGDTIKLIAHIVDENNLDVNEGQVIFKLNGVTLKYDNGSAIIIKVKNGLAILEYNMGTKLTLTSYQLSAVYNSAIYGRTEIVTNLSINLIRTHVVVEPLTTTSTSPKIIAYIYDGQNKLIDGVTTVAIKIAGVSFATTSNNGIINLTLPTIIGKGIYDMEIISGPKGVFLSSRITSVLVRV